MRCVKCLVPLLLISGVQAAITVDGRLTEPEWQEAQVFSNFISVEPATGAPAELQTEALLLPRPDGLYVAFRNLQPESEAARTRTRKPRDSRPMSSDINYFLVDFNANGDTGYEFTVNMAGTQRDGVITQENQFNPDWDGLWESAVSEDDSYWYTEMRIPWSIAPRHNSDTPTRTIAVNFGRFIWSQQKRVAMPGLALDKPRFLSEFQHVEIAQYNSGELYVVPYVAATQDLAHDDAHADGGLDLFWKPNGDHQVAFTLHPDFGQVESDELVVNFSAVEAFFSDKRPFFTENQSVFELRTPDDDLLLHTRRIGAEADDGSAGVSAIDWGLKANGAVGDQVYGVLLSQEQHPDELGRSFAAVRWRYPGESMGVGYLGTRVEHPAYQPDPEQAPQWRDANVHTLDYDWRISDSFSLDGQSSISRISNELDGQENAYSSWLRLKQQSDSALTQQFSLGRESKHYNFSDFGFQQRSNYDFAKWRAEYRDGNFAADSAFQNRYWQFEVNARQNGDGVDIVDVYRVFVDNRFRDTQYWLVELYEESAGFDDLMTRGNNIVDLPARHNLWQAWGSRQDSNFRSEVSLWFHQEGVSGTATQLEWRPSYVLSDALTVGADLRYGVSPDWLIWNHDNTLGRYERDFGFAGLNLNWVGDAQEFRVKLQWLAVDARAREALDVTVDGSMNQSAETLNDFSVNTLGLQARYRYMIGAMSDLFLVYSRGGFVIEEPAREHGINNLFADGLGLRDDEQFMLKLRYRL